VLKHACKGALTDEFVALRFRGLDAEFATAARTLLGSAVGHADNATGDLPAKVLSNMFRFVNLTLKRRQENADAKKAASSSASASASPSLSSPSSSVAGVDPLVAPKSSARNGSHAPSFLRQPTSASAAGGNRALPVDVTVAPLAPVGDTSGGCGRSSGDGVLVPVPRGLEGFVLGPGGGQGQGQRRAPPSQSGKRKGKAGGGGGGGESAERRAQQRRIGTCAEGAAAALAAHGCCVVDGFLAAGLVEVGAIA